MASVVNFDERVLSVFKTKEENKMKKENIIKEQIAPEVKNARAFWYGVMAPTIAEAKKAAKAVATGKKADAVTADAKFGITVAVANRFGIEDTKKAKTVFAMAFEEAKAEQEAKAEAKAKAKAKAAELKRARQAALAARELERKNSVSRIAVAIGWGVSEVAKALKSIKAAVKSELDIKRINAYQAKIKEVSRARMAIASLKQTIGNILGGAKVAAMYAIAAAVTVAE